MIWVAGPDLMASLPFDYLFKAIRCRRTWRSTNYARMPIPQGERL
ncbi:MAG: hypothetical protein V9F00_09910 [Nocardioides sp.]